MQAIEVDQVSYDVRPHFYAKPVHLLKDVSFSVGQGEIFGFLGPNGAGKTTTIKIILNLLTPRRGRALLSGLSSALPQARARTGFLLERTLYPPHLSAEEFVLGHALLAGLSLSDGRRRTREVLEQTGVARAAKQRLATFSKGMLQRTGLAQAIVADPSIVILDEPMSGLDPLGRREVREIMHSLGRAGKTVFFSTHILPDVELICDKVGILVGGQLRRVGPLRELVTHVAQSVEVTLGACDDAAIQCFIPLTKTHHTNASGHTFEVVDHAAANALIDAARARSVPILAVQTAHGGLEQLFVGEAKQ